MGVVVGLVSLAYRECTQTSRQGENGPCQTVGLQGTTATPTLTAMLLPLPSLRKDVVKVKDEMNRWKTYRVEGR